MLRWSACRRKCDSVELMGGKSLNTLLKRKYIFVKMSLGKLVIRGTSKMSLHDRFTQLDYQAPKETILSERGERGQTAPQQRRTPTVSRERMREEVAPMPPGYHSSSSTTTSTLPGAVAAKARPRKVQM